MVYVMLPRIYRTEADIRKQQINTLKVFNANVTEISEGIEYQVAFNAGGNELIIHISLSKDFPNEKPLLRVSPTVIHPWVNVDGDIRLAPGLLNYTIHSDLGRVVQAIIRDFERNPPPLAGEKCGNNISSSSTNVENTSPNYSLCFPPLNNFSPPSQLTIDSNFSQSTSYFPELSKLSLEELHLLNSNADMQQEFVLDDPQIKEQNKFIDELIAHVAELAESNLSKQQELERLRKGIEFRIEEVSKQAFENERRYTVYQNLSEKYSPRNIQEQLRLAAKTSDEESEKVAESFLSGETDVDKFLSSFIKSRTLYQTRKTKEEKLSQQIDSLEKAGF